MPENTLSIIIPVFNEEGSIQELIGRIHETCQKAKIHYEVIVVDDHSTDNTEKLVHEVETLYPLVYVKKQGKKGKAFSLLEGFAKAKYEIVGLIDGDLQYQPESFPEMLTLLQNGADIVVAKRQAKDLPLLRRVTSKVHHMIAAEILHKLDFDIQSGLKIFRKEIIERVHIDPDPWTFDLEFLIKARNAGYKIESVDTVFLRRKTGKEKINLFSDSYQLLNSAIVLKIHGYDAIPFSKTQTEKEGEGFHHKGLKFIHHTDLQSNDSAFFRLSRGQAFFLTLMGLLFVLALLTNWHLTLLILVSIITILYFIDLLFNFFLIIRSFSKPPEIKITTEEINKVKKSEWPIYTIFCPLYREWQVIPQFVSSIENLDYPKDKLEVMLLLEEDDKETIAKLKEKKLPDYIKIIVVPDSMPKTKPKALNYGLKRAHGKFIVIYDAEDVPEPLQLKKAVLAFNSLDDSVVCIQAKLNFYNPHQNVLTKVFTAEYSLWFDLVLTGLQSIKAPIPLGGTSNHFRTDKLIFLKGWDSFNVTEDADLGMRLVKRGFKTAIIDSTTHEEANSNPFNWFRQRTRWIKGYIQTYFVHMRRPQEFIKSWKEPHVITFQLVIGGKVLSMFINPLMWAITISYFLFRHSIGHFIESFYITPIFYMGIFSLVIGNFLYMYYYVIGCAKRDYDNIIKYMFLVPFYWLAMSIASWVAVYEMFKKPHFWPKTVHGLHLGNKKAVAQAARVIGRDLVDYHIQST